MTRGTSRSLVLRLPPAMLSRTILKSSTDMRELRAPGAYPDSPDAGGSCTVNRRPIAWLSMSSGRKSYLEIRA
jgi:hypothetical protein